MGCCCSEPYEPTVYVAPPPAHHQPPPMQQYPQPMHQYPPPTNQYPPPIQQYPPMTQITEVVDPLDTAYKWVHCSAGQSAPPGAVQGGRDVDGTTIYVGRAFHEGDMIPAKVIPEKDVAYVAHGGQEHAKHSFEILVKSDFGWEFSSNGSVPADAVVAGQTSDGEPLYVGRVLHNGSQTLGKVQPSHGCIYIPFDGEEMSFKDYEVLVMH